MKLAVYPDKVEIKPLETSGIIQSSDRFEELGEVLAVGANASTSQFPIEVGDIISFVSHGCWKTPKDVDGVIHYVVTVAPEFILGKLVK